MRNIYDFLRPKSKNECCVSTNGTENVGMVSREIYFCITLQQPAFINILKLDACTSDNQCPVYT